MKKEKLKKEHLSVLKDFGLDKVDNSHISLFIYESGEFILRQGYPSPYIFIVLEGKMKVFITMPNGSTLLICYYSSFVILGEVEMASDSINAASSVQAITDVVCLGIPRVHYQNDMKNSIKFMNAVSKELSQKLSRSNKNSAQTILMSLETRLCRYILNTSINGYFKETLTETSQVLGTSYRHLLRTLKNLCQKGLLEKTPQGYYIKDIQRLTDISGSGD